MTDTEQAALARLRNPDPAERQLALMALEDVASVDAVDALDRRRA